MKIKPAAYLFPKLLLKVTCLRNVNEFSQVENQPDQKDSINIRLTVAETNSPVPIKGPPAAC